MYHIFAGDYVLRIEGIHFLFQLAPIAVTTNPGYGANCNIWDALEKSILS